MEFLPLAPKASASANFATPAREAWVGIAPTYIPFAEECLTTWLPGHLNNLAFLIQLSKYAKL
jgi:hypothetical protein